MTCRISFCAWAKMWMVVAWISIVSVHANMRPNTHLAAGDGNEGELVVPYHSSKTTTAGVQISSTHVENSGAGAHRILSVSSCSLKNAPLQQNWQTCMSAASQCATMGIYIKWSGPTCNLQQPPSCTCFTTCDIYACQDQCTAHAQEGCQWVNNACSSRLTSPKVAPDSAGFCYLGPPALAPTGINGAGGPPTIPWSPPTSVPTTPAHYNPDRVHWKDCSLNNPGLLTDNNACAALSILCRKFGVYMKWTGQTCQVAQQPQCTCATQCSIYACEAMCLQHVDDGCQWMDGSCQTLSPQSPDAYGYCTFNPKDASTASITSRPSSGPAVVTYTPTTAVPVPTAYPTIPVPTTSRPTSKRTIRTQSPTTHHHSAKEYEYETVKPTVKPTMKPTMRRQTNAPTTVKRKHEYEYEKPPTSSSPSSPPHKTKPPVPTKPPKSAAPTMVKTQKPTNQKNKHGG